jgi:hypothetical protein
MTKAKRLDINEASITFTHNGRSVTISGRTLAKAAAAARKRRRTHHAERRKDT